MATNRGNHMKQIQQRGVSLIEVSAVLAVIAIVSAGAIPGLKDLQQRQQTRSVVTEIGTDLQWLRSEAVSRNQGIRISFSSGANGQGCYVIHTGAASACTCQAVGPAQCVGDAREIKTVSQPTSGLTRVHANVSYMLYAPQHGTTTPGGSVFITGADGRSVKHVVSLMGRVRTCSPEGAVTGYPRC